VLLSTQPLDLPLWEAVNRAVCRFNDFPAEADPPHSERMRLILHTPALQSHSVHRHADWRLVIEEYVAERLECGPDDPVPGLVGHLSLALAQASYEAWMLDPSESLPDLISTRMQALRHYLGAG
jgi:hypothetical protein